MDIIVFILVGLLVGLALGYFAFVVLRKQQLEKERSSIIEESKLQG